MNCRDPKAGCEKCIHGTCKGIDNCLMDDIKVKDMVNACLLNSFTMGNSRTIDFYCGKDPNNSLVHLENTPLYHYPGCGLQKDICTSVPCCDVVLVIF
jgi:hypothetical protein